MKKGLVLGIITIFLLAIFLAGCGEKAGDAKRMLKIKNYDKHVGQKLLFLEKGLEKLKSDVDAGKISKSGAALKIEIFSTQLNKLEVPEDSSFFGRFTAAQLYKDNLFTSIEKMYDYEDVTDVIVRLDTIKDNLKDDVDEVITIEGIEYARISALAFYDAAGFTHVAKTKTEAKDAIAKLGFTDVFFSSKDIAGAVKLTTGGVETMIQQDAIAFQYDIVDAEILLDAAYAKEAGLPTVKIENIAGKDYAIYDAAAFTYDKVDMGKAIYREGTDLYTYSDATLENDQGASAFTYVGAKEVGLASFSKEQFSDFYAGRLRAGDLKDRRSDRTGSEAMKEMADKVI